MLLLDTNIVSFAFKRDTRARLYERHLQGTVAAISFMTLAELYKWPLERGFSEERNNKFAELIASLTVLPVDDKLAKQWAVMVVDLKQRGKTMSVPDS